MRVASLFDEITSPSRAVAGARAALFGDMAALPFQYSAAVICDLSLGKPKHFEVSALGLAPVRDDETADGLAALGYRDRDAMILYGDGADLLDKRAYYRPHDTGLRRIRERARAVAQDHTGELRDRDLRLAIESRL